MAVDVIMPQMGESIFEGTITKWLKKPGDKIDRDEPLFEISTDKVDAEIPSPAAGVLKEIKVDEGKTVPIQTVVAVIETGSGARAGAPSPAPVAPEQSRSGASAPPQTPTSSAAQPPVPQPAATGPQRSAPPAAASGETPARDAVQSQRPAQAASARKAGPGSAGGDGKRIHSSPLVRRLARENNVDLSAIRGTGAGGRISKKDILAAISEGGTRERVTPTPPASSAAPVPATAAPAPAAPSAAYAAGMPAPAAGAAFAAASGVLGTAVPRERIYFGHYQVQPMSVMRQRIAEHMVLSKRTSPHVYSIDEADMTRIAHVRSAMKADFEQRHGMKLTFMPFFVRACAGALRDFPAVNASVDGSSIVLHSDVNIGIAVALDWGLIVPVLKNAEEKNFLGLQRGINDLAERARNKKLRPEDVQDSTFSITNPGTFGGLMGLPVINQPNVAILGIGAIQKRPVVIDDAIAIRSMVYLTLSYDHRVVDGAVAHRFMGQVKHRLENWNEDIL